MHTNKYLQTAYKACRQVQRKLDKDGWIKEDLLYP
jgi:hypothetical protein